MTDPALSPAQLREARKLLGWPRDRLAARLNISAWAIARIENEGLGSAAFDLQKAREILEAAGVEFIEGGTGVRLRKSEK